MEDANHICTLGDYSKPSHEGYKNTIELLVRNNVVPIQSDTIRLMQNGCSFHELWSEDPNQHLKDFLKLVDSLNLNGENKERTRLRLFQFSLPDQASNCLERLLAGSITTWEDLTTQFGGVTEIPCNIGGPKSMNALVDQGSDVNVMPLSTYLKLTDERPAKTDIRLSLASHSYIYLLGIAEDVLVDVASFMYHMDFVILDIKEDENRPFILGSPFLTTAKAVIKFDKGTINLRSRKSKISFHRIHESLCKVEKETKNNIRPIAPTMTLNRLILEWEEKIKLHREKR
nr:MAK10-like protein [Tanacetum cinerariifolium]